MQNQIKQVEDQDRIVSKNDKDSNNNYKNTYYKRFQDKWGEDEKYSECIRPVDGDNILAKCIVCDSKLSAISLVLNNHLKSNKHLIKTGEVFEEEITNFDPEVATEIKITAMCADKNQSYKCTEKN